MESIAVGPPDRFRLGYRPGLDGLRGLALVVVVAFHAHVPGVRAGHMGLIVFFVLSGFLITVLLLQEERDTGGVRRGRFLLRRATRIYPALLVFVLAVGAFVQLTARAETARAQWRSTLSALAGVANIQHGVSEHPLLLLEHTWSIAVELQFYLVWPLLLVAVRRRGVGWRPVVAGMLAVALTAAVVRGLWFHLRWTEARLYPRLLTGTDMHLDHLLIGCLLGIAAVEGHLQRLGRHPRLVAAVATAAVGYLAWFTVTVDTAWWGWMFAGGSTLVALAAAAVITAGLLRPDLALVRLLSSPPLVWLGTISYGVYLWHVPIYRVLRARTPGWPLWAQGVVGAALAVGLAVASFRLVERPALALKQRWAPAPSTGEVPSAPADPPPVRATD